MSGRCEWPFTSRPWLGCARARRECCLLSVLALSAVRELAFPPLQGYHGTPSGIDNTASTYGGLIRFQRTDAEPIFKMKKLGSRCEKMKKLGSKCEKMKKLGSKCEKSRPRQIR